VTSKSADTTQMAFRAVGLREHFEVVVTASDTAEHKPSPVPLRLCLERFGAPAQGALYVGDSPVDIEAGRAAGMATAAVAWGVFGPGCPPPARTAGRRAGGTARSRPE
jgi:pyrophosphatase PpaX